jgi:uncharacterized cupin superfamily protein
MTLKPPALDPKDVAPLTDSGYPAEFVARVLPRERRGLGDALGLTRIGVSLATLEPGRESSMRHWHTHEDEFVYVLTGEVVLRTDAGEQTLVAGQCAGFKAGASDGHQFVNRTTTTVTFLAISNRDPADQTYYPDVDLQYNAPAVPDAYSRKDGTPY